MEDGNQDSLVEQDQKQIFDMTFQMALLKLALRDDYFCAQLSRYLGEDKEIMSGKYQAFSSMELQTIFKKITLAFKEFGTKPDEAQLRQMIMNEPGDDQIKNRNQPSREKLYKALELILSVDITNENHYRSMMTAYVKQVKTLMSFQKFKEVFQKNPDDAPSKMQMYLDEITKITFEKEDSVTLADLDKFLLESANSLTMSIATGIKDLDKDLNGGFPRETLVTILAGTNVGKSMFCISLGAQALKACDSSGTNLGYKVLYIPLEGRRDETIMRFASCLSGVEYGKLISGTLTPDEKKRIKDIQEKYTDRLLVRNMMDFNTSIEKLMAEVGEINKRFQFDYLIIDYGQLLSAQATTEGLRFTMMLVFRGLAALSRKYNCVVVSPVQATRQGQESQSVSFNKGSSQDNKYPVLRSSDISEAFEIARVSGIIISLNMTDDERAEGKLRIFLEKQRHGMKGKSYGCITDYPRCNLITGRFYNPKSDAIIGEAILGDSEKGEATVYDPNNQTFDLRTALGQGVSLEKAKMIEKMNNYLISIEQLEKDVASVTEEMKLEKENNPLELEEADGAYLSMKKELETFETELDIQRHEFLKMFNVVHEFAKESDIDEIKVKLSTLRASKADEDKKRVEDTEILIKRFRKGFELKK